MKFFLLTLLLSFYSIAGIKQAPPSFKHKESKAVFADFLNATYQLTYDYKKRVATSVASIKFKTLEAGYPIFDSVNSPSKVVLDGEDVEVEYIDVPGKVSQVIVPKKVVSAGVHVYRITTPINNGVAFTRKGVSSAFFIKDLADRKFLEKYIPSNYEFDQYPMNFRVKVLGSINRYNIFSNGVVTQLGKNYFELKFPKFYTSSSVYYHLAPRSKFAKLRFKFKSISGKKIPVTIYSISKLRNRFFAKKTIKVLKELERDYGAWPHPALLVYGSKLKGGMEYVGATVTSLISLGHELQHSYFAKGILPANGNSGWMDEAIASWRDKGHQTTSSVNYHSFNLGNHNIYTRKTDSNSYEKGRSFMAYLDFRLKAIGSKGLKDFLRKYFEKRKFTTVRTKDFISDLKEYSGFNFQKEFDRYILGIGQLESKGRSPAVLPSNPHHGHIGEKELESLL